MRWRGRWEQRLTVKRHDLIGMIKMFQNCFMVIVVQLGKFTKNH